MKAEHISIATTLEHIPNVGRQTAKLLREAGIQRPLELCEHDPYSLYDKICQLTRRTHDYRLLDVLLSAVDFASGNSPRHWSSYSVTRRQLVSARLSERKQ